uniref:Transglutaminase domain protein n=1 Tax=Geobacter sp. (strain M21) TaxID=443144 RepID=C6E2N1_GEOSM
MAKLKIEKLLNLLAGLIALLGYLPLQPYLDPLPRYFFPVSLLGAFYLQRTGRALPTRLLTPLSIALFLYYAVGFSVDRLVPVTGDLLVLFLAVRLLGDRSGRHYLQAFALSLFCLAASSLYEISAVFLLYLLLLLFLMAVSLVLLTFHAHDPAIALAPDQGKKVLAVSVLIPVASLPILLVLFVLLPRTQYPLWHFLAGTAGKKTGLSDSVQPGDAASVTEVKGAVLRAITGKLPEEKLYWRGVVLNGFRGDSWVRLPVPEELPPVQRGGAVLQEIYPERSQSSYLLALNTTRSISGLRHDEANDAVFTSRRPLDRKVKYVATSVIGTPLEVKGGVDRGFYLQLPSTLPERILAKGRDLARAGLAPPERMRLLEAFFRNQRITYANTELPVGPQPLDSFLFGKRRGNCEYFASSYATLLRLAGIPSRLVGGYRGGSYNDMGGYYLVTEDMAHVWVEAYVDGVGWQTVDPSAWAIGSARRAASARGISMYFDAVSFYWDKAVVSYDLDKQIALVRRAGGKARDLRLPAGFVRGSLALLLLMLPLAALGLWLKKRPASREERVLRKMLRAARKRYPGDTSGEEGLFELSARLDDPLIREFASIYGGAVYRDRPLRKEELARLKEIVRELRQHGP